MSDPVIVVDGLHKRYGSFEAVRGTSFAVEAGEVFGLLGTNGAGKTTTIEILEGYRARTSGTVSVLGVDPAAPTRAWRERIGLVLQESELDPVYTARETVAMFARYFRAPRPVDETLHLVGLDEKADARIGELSGGQRRRVDVAIGLIGRPELLFLDEPTTGFDPNARREFWSGAPEGGAARALRDLPERDRELLDRGAHLGADRIEHREVEVVDVGRGAGEDLAEVFR